ncbi:hypothetical protein [Streptomyces murinus]|uniref:hypothetical protein n=1 Tax=Streptomyces murinus TaxID=33900 RepID=UPI0018F35940|nr:hypothetical protein [Streptomyces murinus]
MRATIRRAKFNDIVSDARAAMAVLEIDDTAPYYRLTEVERPGQAPEITEEVLSGYQVRSHISHQLLLVMEEVEQNGPDEVTIRRTSPYITSPGGRQTTTYSKVC